MKKLRNYPPLKERTLKNGYIEVLSPAHPRVNQAGYVAEHILIAEKALGRPLDRKHPVHHHDRNRENNANTNLVICEDNAYHQLLHYRMRALEESGNADFLRCELCGKWDDPVNLTIGTKTPTRKAHVGHSRCYTKATWDSRHWPFTLTRIAMSELKDIYEERDCCWQGSPEWYSWNRMASRVIEENDKAHACIDLERDERQKETVND